MNTGFTMTLHSAADPESVRRAVTTAEGIGSWWQPATSVGPDLIEVRWGPGDGHVVLRVQGGVVVGWNVVASPMVPDWIGTRPTFALTPARNGGTEITFTHEGLTPLLDCWEMCARDWPGYLHQLAALSAPSLA